MNGQTIIALTVLCFSLLVLLIVLIRRWYIQNSSAKAKGKVATDDLKEMIGKVHDTIGRSTISKGTLKEKLEKVPINILIAQVKAWLKEGDEDKLRQ